MKGVELLSRLRTAHKTMSVGDGSEWNQMRGRVEADKVRGVYRVGQGERGGGKEGGKEKGGRGGKGESEL